MPYGELEWVLAIVDKWREAAGVDQGPVFRGFYKGHRKVRPGYRKLRPGQLSVRAVEYIVGAYPVRMGGERVRVKPHDLRRTTCGGRMRGGCMRRAWTWWRSSRTWGTRTSRRRWGTLGNWMQRSAGRPRSMRLI